MSQSDFEVILYRLDSMAKSIDEIRAEQKAITSRGICPMPGSCVVLQRDVDTFKTNMSVADDRLRSLENLRAEGRGAAVVAKAIWAFIGAGGLGVVYAGYHLVQHKP